MMNDQTDFKKLKTSYIKKHKYQIYKKNYDYTKNTYAHNLFFTITQKTHTHTGHHHVGNVSRGNV